MRFVFFKTSKLFLTIKNKCKYTLVINTMLTSPLAETQTESHMTDQKKITLVIFVERKQNRWAAKFVTILTQCSVLRFIYLGSDVVCLHPQTQTCTTSKHKMISFWGCLKSKARDWIFEDSDHEKRLNLLNDCEGLFSLWSWRRELKMSSC